MPVVFHPEDQPEPLVDMREALVNLHHASRALLWFIEEHGYKLVAPHDDAKHTMQHYLSQLETHVTLGGIALAEHGLVQSLANTSVQQKAQVAQVVV